MADPQIRIVIHLATIFQNDAGSFTGVFDLNQERDFRVAA